LIKLILWILYQKDPIQPIAVKSNMSGYYFVRIPGLHNLFEQFKKQDFDAEHEAKGAFQRKISSEEWSKLFGSAQQRESWFIDGDWAGPYGEQFKAFYQLIDPHWRTFINERGLEKVYDPNKYMFSMGIHQYDPADAGEGLQAHEDVGLVTLLYSDGPLDGLIDGEWKTINIPHDHLMVFTGLTTCLATGESALLHRVPHVERKKFTIGAFIGAAEADKLAIHKTVTVSEKIDKLDTVSDLNASYFSGDFKWSLSS